MHRHWLLTSTTYGTWLPGDPRGSVTSVRDYRPSDAATNKRLEHDQFGTPWESAQPGLVRSAQSLLRMPPLYFNTAQAEIVCAQMVRTAVHRKWNLLAVAVMANHFHVVIAADELVTSGKLLGDLKAYAARGLNAQCGARPAGTWFTQGGSQRLLTSDSAVSSAINYVLRRQHAPLVLWEFTLKQPNQEPGSVSSSE